VAGLATITGSASTIIFSGTANSGSAATVTLSHGGTLTFNQTNTLGALSSGSNSDTINLGCQKLQASPLYNCS
jgi:hypothetical protein